MEILKCDVCVKSFTGLVCFQQHEASEKHKKKVQLMKGVDLEGPKADIFSDSVTKPISFSDSMGQPHCSVCNILFPGWDSYQKHVNSLDHAIMIQKKGNDFLNPILSNSFQSNTVQSQLTKSTGSFNSPSKTTGFFTECKPCQKQFSGPEPYQQHLESAGHKKKCRLSIDTMQNDEIDSIVRKDNINDNFHHDPKSSESGLSNTVQSQLTKSTASFNSPSKTTGFFTECKPCQKQFSGPEPYQQHLESAGHKKKCRLSINTMQNDEIDSIVRKDNINDNLPHDPKSSESGCNGNETVPRPFAKCDTCEMQFNDALSYQLHLVSDSHKMKTSNQLLGNSLTASQSAFKCGICNMTFSGPIPYDQHLVSNGHQKKKIAAGLSLKLAEMGSLLPSDTAVEDSYTGLEQSITNGRQWYCYICNKQCSGPIPYNTHIAGADHSKNAKIKEIEAKLLKVKVMGLHPFVENHTNEPDLDNQVTSTVNLDLSYKSELEESALKSMINDLNRNIKSGPKIFSDNYEMNSNDLITLPSLNIIPPEKLDITVFHPMDEIVFSSPKKSIQK